MEFEWDQGNQDKNWEKHRVTREEAEQCFYHRHWIFYDEQHSQNEERYFLYGETEEGRCLLLVFTVRARSKIRVISARPMKRREKDFYEKLKKNS